MVSPVRKLAAAPDAQVPEPTEPTAEPTTEPTTEPTPAPARPIDSMAFTVPDAGTSAVCTDLIVTKTDYIRGKLTSHQPYGETSVVDARLRVRGNSTATIAAKRPYKVKLDKSTSMFQMPKSKDWVLLANYFDRSMLRNDVAMETARRLGFAWAPRLRPVEFRINGQFCGLYQFGEGIELDQHRVNLANSDVLLEADNNEDDDPKFRSSRGLQVYLKDGDQQDLERVARQFQEVEDLIYAPNFP